MKIALYIGLDVHKDSISIAVAESGRDGRIHSYGKISNSLYAVDKLIARLRKQYGKDVYVLKPYPFGMAPARVPRLGETGRSFSPLS